MDQTFRPLLDALKQRGADPRAVEEAAEEAERTGRSLRDVLINESVVTETELTEASADAYGINSVDLLSFPIDAAAAAKIPLSVVLRHRVLGLAINGDEIVVGSPTRATSWPSTTSERPRGSSFAPSWWRAASCAGSSTGCSAKRATSATSRRACAPSPRRTCPS